MVNFWVRKGNTLDAPPLTLVEDVLEDKVQEETSLHVLDENMSDDREEKEGEKEEEIAEKEKKVTSTSTNAKKMRRSVPSNLSTAIPSIRSSPRRRSQLVTSASPAPVIKERSPFKVETRLTRLQKKVEMAVLMEERRKVPQFALLNPNISRRARGVKRSIKSEGLETRRSM